MRCINAVFCEAAWQGHVAVLRLLADEGQSAAASYSILIRHQGVASGSLHGCAVTVAVTPHVHEIVVIRDARS